jgi:hypothetical protein
MSTRPQLLSGARGTLKINGVEVAFVTNVSVTIQAQVRPIHTFGAANARSVEPLSVGAQVSIGRVFPVNDSQGNPIDTSSISASMGFVEPIINMMLTAQDIEVELTDRMAGVTVANVKNCRFAGRSMNISASQIAQENINLIGIYDAAGGNTPEQIGL